MHVPTAPFGFKHKPVPSIANILFCISCQHSVTLTHKRNTTHTVYWLSFQHRSTFPVSTVLHEPTNTTLHTQYIDCLFNTAPQFLSAQCYMNPQTQHYTHNILTVYSTPLHISCHHSVTLTHKHNTTHKIYWLSFQHRSTIPVSTVLH